MNDVNYLPWPLGIDRKRVNYLQWLPNIDHKHKIFGESYPDAFKPAIFLLARSTVRVISLGSGTTSCLANIGPHVIVMFITNIIKNR